MSEMVGPGFDLPDEILSVIPMDPYEQLDLARKITSMAIASRVSNLESETHNLRQTLKQKDGLISQLEDRVLRIDQALHETDLQLKAITDDNTKLSRERDSLAATARKLSRDLAKLETFKRRLMQSLNDDDPSPAETVDIETYDQSNPKHNFTKEEVNGYATHNSYRGSFESGNNVDDALKQTGQRFSITPYITPRLTPTTTPKILSTNGSPRRYFAVESPQTASGATSPTKAKYAMSSWYSSSQQSSAANSPPRGRSITARATRIDGKEFFRQARSRLAHEQFTAFLANIKELNAQKQSREEALRKAEEIFGTDNKDLYLSFQGLLNRNVH